MKNFENRKKQKQKLCSEGHKTVTKRNAAFSRKGQESYLKYGFITVKKIPP